MNEDEGPVCTNGVYGCESQAEKSPGPMKEELIIYCYDCETYMCTTHSAEHDEDCLNAFLMYEDEYYLGVME